MITTTYKWKCFLAAASSESADGAAAPRTTGSPGGRRGAKHEHVRNRAPHSSVQPPFKAASISLQMSLTLAQVSALLANRRVQAALAALTVVGLAAGTRLALRARFAALSAIVTTKHASIGAFDCSSQQRPKHMPDTVITASILEPTKAPVFYDSFELRVPLSTLPLALRSDAGSLLTAYLRHSLPRFAVTPQGWMLRLVAQLLGNAQAGATTPSQIMALDLLPGDTILGACIVDCRDTSADGISARLQLRMRDPWRSEVNSGTGGALMFAVTFKHGASLGGQGDSDTALFETTTVMWSSDHVRAPMPMSSPLAAWVHALTAMTLLVDPVRELANAGAREAAAFQSIKEL